MANKLLLLEDVDALGRKGDIVNARPGFARNFLMPRGLAIVADANALRRQARLQEERRQQAVVDKKEADAIATKIQDAKIKTYVKIDHEGHMYGSVTALDIVHLMKDQLGVEVEKRFILLPHAIKELGVHTIKARLKEGVLANFTLKVLAEGAPEEEEKEVTE